MSKLIQLSREDETRTYIGAMRYVVLYDHGSGRARRFTVLVLTAKDPVIIGRELPLYSVPSLIAWYDRLAEKEGFLGSRKQVRSFVKQHRKFCEAKQAAKASG